MYELDATGGQVTRKVFWEDPYLDTLAATITSVAGDEVQLDATIFFAFSGGQERDHGTIAGHEVVDARWDNADLTYTLAPGHTVALGDSVTVQIDVARRDRLRRLHMATEIVLELLMRKDPSLVKTGAHISADKARIDFAADSPITHLIDEVAVLANRIIEDDFPIESGFSDEVAERRYWEISGFARVPCSGTHPRSTGEIGGVRLRRRNPGKGRERVEITLA